MQNNDFKVHVLASGSKGNSILVQAGNTAFLIDAGISARQITTKLAQIGLKQSDLAGIFITHEHNDHIKGLPVFSKQAQVPIFAREKTWLASGCLKQIDKKHCRLLPLDNFVLGDITIKPFFISHDAAEPVGFSFFYKEQKCSLATDLGFVSDDVKQSLANSDIIILEANHDRLMLSKGRYPRFLKERIKSVHGHLSNVEAGNLLAEIVENQTQIFLAHLSQENNRPSVAERTVKDILESKDMLHKSEIYIASQNFIVSNCSEENKVK